MGYINLFYLISPSKWFFQWIAPGMNVGSLGTLSLPICMLRLAADGKVLVEGVPRQAQGVNLFFKGVFLSLGRHLVSWEIFRPEGPLELVLGHDQAFGVMRCR